MGLSNEPTNSQTHFESLIEISAYFLQRKLIPSFVFRWSGDGFPRNEIEGSLTYGISEREHFANSIQASYTFQDFYGIPFHFVGIGTGILIR